MTDKRKVTEVRPSEAAPQMSEEEASTQNARAAVWSLLNDVEGEWQTWLKVTLIDQDADTLRQWIKDCHALEKHLELALQYKEVEEKFAAKGK